MPELPEVETIRLDLQKDIVGKRVKSVNILVKKQFVGNPKKITGAKIISIKRVGKNLSFALDNNLFLNIHLKMTGQLLYTKNINQPVFKNPIPFIKDAKMPGKTTRVIITFTDNSAIFFNDMRKFGWMKINDSQQKPNGIDVLAKEFTSIYFRKLIQLTSTSSRPIKLFLLDQDKIAGIGNIYANEALFLAKIHPERKTNTFNDKEINHLYLAIKKVIKQGLKYKGSSAADEAYILPNSSKGSYQNHFLVYQKEGEKCLKCRSVIKRLKQAGRSSFFCPKCQLAIHT